MIHRKMLRARLAYDALPMCGIAYHEPTSGRLLACQNRAGHQPPEAHCQSGVSPWPPDAREATASLLDDLEVAEQDRDAYKVANRPMQTALQEIAALLGQWTGEDVSGVPVADLPDRLAAHVAGWRGLATRLLEPARALLEAEIVGDGDNAAEKKAVRAFRNAVQGAAGVVIE